MIDDQKYYRAAPGTSVPEIRAKILRIEDAATQEVLCDVLDYAVGVSKYTDSVRRFADSIYNLVRTR